MNLSRADTARLIVGLPLAIAAICLDFKAPLMPIGPSEDGYSNFVGLLSNVFLYPVLAMGVYAAIDRCIISRLSLFNPGEHQPLRDEEAGAVAQYGSEAPTNS